MKIRTLTLAFLVVLTLTAFTACAHYEGTQVELHNKSSGIVYQATYLISNVFTTCNADAVKVLVQENKDHQNIYNTNPGQTVIYFVSVTDVSAVIITDIKDVKPNNDIRQRIIYFNKYNLPPQFRRSCTV